MSALLDRIATPIVFYPRVPAESPDGDVGQQLIEGDPVTIDGYITSSSSEAETTEGQGYDQTVRVTARSLRGVDPVSLRNARFVHQGRTFFTLGTPEEYPALADTYHWRIRGQEVVP